MTQPAPNNLDDLMDRDPLSLTREDIDAIIAAHRKNRASQSEGGGKRAKASREAGPKADISAVMGNLIAAKPVGAIRRR